MAAYLIVNVEVKDPERFAEYARLSPPCIARYGGEYLARGGKAEKLEGAWEPRRVVVVRFGSFEEAKAWWASEEYRGPKALRQSCAVTNMILVEGLA
jgi:uncharacterized protein (DUF1330 family)